jgi:uncharacterized membrane protein YkoI
MRWFRALLTATLAVFSVFTATAYAAGRKVPVKEERPGLLTQAKVAPEVAEATAQAKLPRARVVSVEIEQENGRLIYTFDFKSKGKSGVDEVNVDAFTGNVVGIEHESPKAEAKEKTKRP